jgi:hypothetical protein
LLNENSEILKISEFFVYNLGEICNTLRGVWGEYVAEGF